MRMGDIYGTLIVSTVLIIFLMAAYKDIFKPGEGEAKDGEAGSREKEKHR